MERVDLRYELVGMGYNDVRGNVPASDFDHELSSCDRMYRPSQIVIVCDSNKVSDILIPEEDVSRARESNWFDFYEGGQN